ncbi:MAG: phage holin family protein [Ginsengibacter sp.]
MENAPTAVEELFYKLKDYIETTADLFKLKAINKVSGFTSTLIVSIVLIILLFLIMICISFGFALLIGDWLGHAYWGFFIMGILYLIIGLILFSNRNKILKEPISNKFIKELID